MESGDLEEGLLYNQLGLEQVGNDAIDRKS